jgi:hypothetical protein
VTMTCTSCGTENRPGRKSCAECAAPLAVACPTCGASNEPGEKSCGECAAPLLGAGSTPAPGIAAPPAIGGRRQPAPVAERRLVSEEALAGPPDVPRAPAVATRSSPVESDAPGAARVD